ncbi:MAG: ASCH domain-containing protein [Tepidisphaeraceae bacterium]
MRVLSIRQPYAELILRGVKTIEYRSRPTKIVGERFLIYASKAGVKARSQAGGKGIWSSDVEPPASTKALPWMLELATALRLFTEELPTGMIVGSAVIDRVEAGDESTGGLWRWHLKDAVALASPRKPRGGHPQPVWWREVS